MLHRHTSRWTQVTVVRLRGPVDPDRLERAIVTVIERHPALRTRVRVQQGRAWQWFAAEAEFNLICHDRPTSEPDRAAAIDEFLKAITRVRFTLYNAPLFRGDLLTLSPLDRVLALRLHHIAADGIALALIVSQIAAFYKGELPVSGPDMAYEHWLDRGSEQTSAPGFNAALEFYNQELLGAKTHYETLYDQDPDCPSHDPPDLPEVTFTLGSEVCEALRRLARSNGATLFIVLFAAYGAVLRAAVGSADLVIATFVSGRVGEPEPLVGSCINTLLVRLRLNDRSTAAELIAAVQAAWRPVREHQAAPLMLLSDAASLPMAQFAINYLDMAGAVFELPGVVSAVTHAQQGFPLNDLLLYALREQDGQLRLRLIVGSGTSRLSQDRLASLLCNLVGLLRSWVANPLAT